jgi:hypothetical protein
VILPDNPFHNRQLLDHQETSFEIDNEKDLAELILPTIISNFKSFCQFGKRF